jgi:hypothetical protein
MWVGEKVSAMFCVHYYFVDNTFFFFFNCKYPVTVLLFQPWMISYFVTVVVLMWPLCAPKRTACIDTIFVS